MARRAGPRPTVGPHTHSDAEAAPALEELGLADRPDGPGAAAIVAAGAGVFLLGLFTTLSEVSEGFKSFMEAFDVAGGVGPLAGKTTLAVLLWLVVWGVLTLLWRARDVDLHRAFAVGVALGLLGAVGTFPLFFEVFAT